MSFKTIQQEIETVFAIEWGNTTPIKYENVPLDTANVPEYVAINIREGEAVQSSLGEDGTFSVVGVVLFNVFTKRQIGSGRARELGDQLADSLRGKKLATVRLQVPRGVPVPNKSPWFQFNVSVPFYAYFNL